MSTLLFSLLLTTASAEDASSVEEAAMPNSCGSHSAIIYGGQFIETAEMNISMEETELVFHIDGINDWLIKEVQIYVGSDPIPTGRTGNPAPGQFPFKQELTVARDTVDMAIDWDDIEEAACGDTLNAVVHTLMVQTDEKGNLQRAETGWAFGDHVFTGGRWGWWFELETCCIFSCPGIDMQLTAGQTIEAGRVNIIDDGESLVITTEADYGWELKELHVYAGLEPVPVNNAGNPAPGRFPQVMEFDQNVEIWKVVIPLADLQAVCPSTLNIAVHATVESSTRAGLTETAWAQGAMEFEGNRWGWWTTYDLCCQD